MKKTIITCTLSLTLLLSSCATIISGSKQYVSFTSNPSEATILIDQVEVGKTPFNTKLKRNSDHKISITLEGYKPFETTLKRKINGWYWGNILLGGLIGVIVDMSTGAVYRLSPKEINAELSNGTAFKDNSKEIYIAVSLDIDPNWQKIGQLEKSN